MKKYTKVVKRFLALATPAIATSILATLPSQAATFASSESIFNINNFSSSPLDVRTLTDNVTTAISTGGQVTADSNAEAKFNIDVNNSASNLSFSQAQGQGDGYTGSAESFAAIIGYDFIVDKEFSFDFSGLFSLKTSIDDAVTERANARGEFLYELYDSDTRELLDSFKISGNLSTIGNNDAFVFEPSSSITLDSSIKNFFGGTQEYALANFQGKYSRTFDKSTRLLLKEYKSNQVSVYTVPEPSTILGSLFSCTMFGAVSIRKRKRASSAALLVNKDLRSV
ncbi:PEP-CTERM sorting domain-containing protein [Nostoc cf. edaphicum LEGE 07299]|uniref:PEP-CTERM sorting domain-containing protein n=1 Tax=Nostoc cf. edaphicum LEGE 07299 TaxID=2777974 RepID=A0ABR9TVK7_9NOSO|nr:PEP-CTERM sorting domain-containing protein [Nostoc edaphicum]MBE9104157.1 PEP-CTERM sorting domain-containing protein [Nostoc cf. edaphicum LEGE 07299]